MNINDSPRQEIPQPPYVKLPIHFVDFK